MEIKRKVEEKAGRIEHGILKFVKDWTLPVSIATGTTLYLLFYHVPQAVAVGQLVHLSRRSLHGLYGRLCPPGRPCRAERLG